MTRFLARLSTRAKISLAFGILVLVAFGILGTLGGRWIERHGTELHAKRLEDNAARLALLLDVGLFERLRDITNLAASIDVSPSAGLRQADVDRLQATFAHYAWIGIADAQGRVVTAARGVLLGGDVSARDWWKAGLKGPAVLGVHEAALLKHLLPREPDDAPPRLLDVAAPIVAGGRPVGVLGAHLSWRWAGELDQQAGELLSRQQVEHFVFDAEGRNLQLRPSQAGLQVEGLMSLVNQPARVVRWSDGGLYLTSAVRRTGYRNFPGLGWIVVVRQPESVVTQPVRALVRTSWAVALFAGTLLLLFAWWATGRLLRPLRQAAHVARARLPAFDGTVADEAVQLSRALADLVLQLRQREADLSALAAELERRVAQRTEELELRNNELRGMARMVMHDVRAPVLAMGRLLGMARQAAPSKQAEMLALAVRECEHVGAVIDALQALSTSESRPLDLVPVDMEQLVRESVARQSTASGFGGQVEVGPLPPCRGDPVLLGEVWANLIGNAMKFSRHEPAPRIRVQGETVDGRLVYSVQDNGPGFEPSRAADLFNAFVRLVNDGRFPGSGLGLAIVRRIVERHGGAVQADGRPGEGATFRFWLPAAQAADQRAPA